MDKKIRFLNDIIKPWDELNDLLSKPYAYEPGLNDVTRMAGNLAISIKHHHEFTKAERIAINKESHSNKIMSDIADMIKHHSLGDKNRENKLSISSIFECSNNKFKFLRTLISVKYNDECEFDFALESINAINFWVARDGFVLPRKLEIKICEEEFKDKAILRYEPSRSIQMQTIQLKFFKRNNTGVLEPHDPENLTFEFQNIT